MNSLAKLSIASRWNWLLPSAYSVGLLAVPGAAQYSVVVGLAAGVDIESAGTYALANSIAAPVVAVSNLGFRQAISVGIVPAGVSAVRLRGRFGLLSIALGAFAGLTLEQLDLVVMLILMVLRSFEGFSEIRIGSALVSGPYGAFRLVRWRSGVALALGLSGPVMLGFHGSLVALLASSACFGIWDRRWVTLQSMNATSFTPSQRRALYFLAVNASVAVAAAFAPRVFLGLLTTAGLIGRFALIATPIVLLTAGATGVLESYAAPRLASQPVSSDHRRMAERRIVQLCGGAGAALVLGSIPLLLATNDESRAVGVLILAAGPALVGAGLSAVMLAMQRTSSLALARITSIPAISAVALLAIPRWPMTGAALAALAGTTISMLVLSGTWLGRAR